MENRNQNVNFVGNTKKEFFEEQKFNRVDFQRPSRQLFSTR